MLVSLFDDGINSTLWNIYKDMYSGIKSVVKTDGSLSREFNENQGIRQGASSSSGLFRRSTSLLNEISKLSESYRIGTIEVGAPTCADDTMMLSTSRLGAQLQINLAEYDANCHRYQFSEKKTKIITMNTKANDQIIPLEIYGYDIECSSNETHLGIQRTADGKCKSTIEERVKRGRRSLYSLMGAGLHGLNGCGVKTSLQLYRIYTIPAILHNLEAIIMNDNDYSNIEIFHKSVLRQIQHLPESTAKPALYLLTGELPLIAQMHIRILTFFHRLIMRNNIEKEIIIRQLAMKCMNDRSWVIVVRKLLYQYNLSSAFDILENPPSKESWKAKVQYEVKKYRYWLEKLKEEAKTYKTLKYLNVNACSFDNVHPLWKIGNDPHQVDQATVKAKLLVQ